MSVSKEVFSIMKQRRQELDRQLKKTGCPVDIPKIMPYQLGNNEIVAIEDVYHSSRPYYFVVTFRYKKPFTGELGFWSIKFSCGLVVIPVVEDKIILKYEHRLPTGKWMWEIPRKLLPLNPKEDNDLKRAESLLQDEIPSVFEGSAQVKEASVVSEGVFEDSGMSAASNRILLAKLEGCRREADKKRGRKILWQSFTPQKIWQDRLLQDNHSLAAISFLLNKMMFESFSLDQAA
jgi:hypothetical protein